MNLAHRWLCRSALWRHAVEHDILPWVLADVVLGDALLEVGPGPGATTDVFKTMVPHLTTVEIDSALAVQLGAKLRKTAVRVIQADATALPFAESTFTSAAAFMMLHHLPRPALQDRLFREVHRVLRPGGTFAGTDALPNPALCLLHFGDTLTPVDPLALPARLAAAGFQEIAVDSRRGRFRFRAIACKP